MAKEKKQITRNRISYSCQKCRQRKVKCDKAHPVCGSCGKTGEECIYVITEPESNWNQDSAQPVHDTNRKRARSPTVSQVEDAPPRTNAADTTNLDAQIYRLYNKILDRLGCIAGIPATITAALKNDENFRAMPGERDALESYQSSDRSTLRLTRGGSQTLSGQVHIEETGVQSPPQLLEVISAQFEEFAEILQSKLIERSNYSDGTVSSNHLLSTVQPEQPAESGSSLVIPSEDQRNALFRGWLSSVYPVLPIVDPHVVLMKYRAFHYWYLHGLEKGIPNPAEEYVPLIFAVYYAGIISLSSRGFQKWFPGGHRQRLLEGARKHFIQTLRVSTKLLNNSATLAARVMMYYMAPQQISEIGFVNAVSPLVTTAYACNLHQERMNASLEHTQAATRRRLWWEIVNLDCLRATAANVPPMISTAYFDTILPNEMKDFRLGTPEADRYEAAIRGGVSPDAPDDIANNESCSMVSIINLVMKARTILSLGARRLHNINLIARAKTREDMSELRMVLAQTTETVSAMVSRIPSKGLPELNFTPNLGKPGQSIALDHANTYSDDLISSEIQAVHGASFQFGLRQMPYISQHRVALVAFHKWTRIMLSMLTDQLHCFSYAPFLSNPKRKLWISARQCALRHAHSCLRKYNALATDLELERFRWSWVSMHQPIHACMIILLDVHENPQAREAPRSRALLDQMLSLSSPKYGVVGGENGLSNIEPLQEGGEKAYLMLMQLRARGWHKVGLDPTLLWTEHDQIAVGVAAPPTDAERLARSIREDTVIDGHNVDKHDLHQIIGNRNQEYTHPSVLGPPEDSETISACSEHDQPVDMNPQTRKSLLRARFDQELAPIILAHDVAAVLGDQSGSTYKFKPPSELNDVGELIRKIKSFKTSSKDLLNDDSVQPIQNTATTQTAEADSYHSTTSTDANRKTNSIRPSSMTSNPPPQHPQPDSSTTHIQTFPEPPHSPLPNPAQQSHINHTSSTISITTPPSKPHQPSQRSDPHQHVDLVTMDFDWAKWDETFGHILDESFGDFTPEAMDDDVDVDMAETVPA